MIEQISIRGVGVIGDARMPLGPGFTAVTGETGAGKTMVVSALGLLLGARADSGVVRSGSGGAVVEGEWIVPADGPVAERVREAGGDVDENGDGSALLLLSRSLSEEGRSRATVGGRSAPVGVLAELGEQLVVVHGQSDQLRLRSATAQRETLDRYAGSDVADLLAEYGVLYRRWQDDVEELETLVSERDAREREAAELTGAMDEIEKAAPKPGEDEELTELAERLANVEDLRLAAGQAEELISSQSGGDGADVVALLESARRLLARAAEKDATLAPIVENVTSASILVSEISSELAGYLAGLDTDTGHELEAVQERRAELNALMRRHGPTLDDVLDRLQTGSARLLELSGDSDRIDALEQSVDGLRARLEDLATRLTAARRDAAERLSESVTAELAALAMGGARLVVEVTERDELTAAGRDQVSLLLQPHSGAEPRPLGKGASGGELSRVMLALEVVIAATDPVPTFVFDEVDAGVGGASATEIGRRLARLAETAQVIVVTHLAQVAAFATNHLRVVKDAGGEVTASDVQQLTGEERVAEMARLLSGMPDSASGLAHARELLDTARAATSGRSF
ncbi:DNA repair protein RecN [Herbiconiux sp. SYSU D00978]|uniref:DNA repair protein RecN n=1 Tax=Herbiconiux sp. SYSU D00978 TaxID=2812562 RepID=UPI001A959182|nr:DNA repair protein RecN [Herbiconiux sp. SYSU D00978]